MCFSVVKTGYNKFALNSKHLEIKDMSKVCSLINVIPERFKHRAKNPLSRKNEMIFLPTENSSKIFRIE